VQLLLCIQALSPKPLRRVFLDTNFLIDIVDGLRGEVGVDKVKLAHETGRLFECMSTFHPGRSPVNRREVGVTARSVLG
jgi:hypothetical protein